MDQIELVWTRARSKAGFAREPRRPRPSIAAVVIALSEANGQQLPVSEIARRAGQDQGNTSNYYLPKLERFGFASWAGEEPGHGHQGGGRPAMFWRLTRAGRELAELLETSRAAA